MSKIITNGFRYTPDKRDFKLGAIAQLVNLREIAYVDFEVGRSQVLDQQASDFCTGFSTAAASSIQEDKVLDPYWAFAASKYLSGDKDTWGQDQRISLKVHTKMGCPELQNYNPIDFEYLRNYENYSDLQVEAKFNLKKTYFEVNKDGYDDLFDGFRASLWQFREKKQAIITGALWREEWTSSQEGIIEDKEYGPGFAHQFILIGQKYIKDTCYLVAQLSNGKDIGKQGYFYFPRGVINKYFVYGNYMFVDLEREVAQVMSDFKLKLNYKWLAHIFRYPYYWLNNLKWLTQ